MKNILVVFGTRPEVIKLAPVILALKKSKRYCVTVCNTEQQKELSNQTLSFFGLKADIQLDSMLHNQSLAQLQTRLMSKIDAVLNEHAYDAVIIQGDTMTVLSAALVAFYRHIPIFHIEAGLRSFDLNEPFPEEAIRQMVSRVSTLHFCPTRQSVDCLQSEKLINRNFFDTGNTVIDALHCISTDATEAAKFHLLKYGIDFSNPLVLVTAHRRENHGERLDHIIHAIKDLAILYKNTQFIIPVHPNPNVRTRVLNSLANIDNVFLLPPLPYPELVLLMRKAALIMTDSGGIQEEAPTFGCPLLVLRYETERMEGVKSGFAKLVGADYSKIIESAKKILSNRDKSSICNIENPYGDGKSSVRILNIIDNYFNNKPY